MTRSFPNHRGHGRFAPDDYRTPRDLFDALDDRWGPFELDAAANDENHLCDEYFTVETNGLFQTWSGNVWVNPPFHSIDAWVDKAVITAKDGFEVTMLVPARTGTKWWGVANRWAEAIFFMRGRLAFTGPHSPEGGKSIEDCVIIRFTPLGIKQGRPTYGLMSSKGQVVGVSAWREL